MKFVMDNWWWVTIAVVSGGMLLWPMLQGAATTGLSAAAAVQLMNKEKAVVIDVCEADEFGRGHVVGARNIPLGQLQEKLAASVKNKSLPLILVCQSGGRSARALAIARKLGYEQAYSLAGGLGAWRTANLPTEKA